MKHIKEIHIMGLFSKKRTPEKKRYALQSDDKQKQKSVPNTSDELKNQAEQQAAENLKQIFGEGMTAYRAKDYVKALPLFEKAAEQGHKDSQYFCGTMYHIGNGTKADRTRALMWYKKAAEQGHAYSQYFCGTMYHNGEGTAADIDQAVMWYEKAAEQEHESAKKALAKIKSHTEKSLADKTSTAEQSSVKSSLQPEPESSKQLFQEGCAAYEEKDYAKALPLFEKAAEQGLINAQFLYGAMHYNGEGTETDYAKALIWFEKAAEHGDANAAFRCGKIYCSDESIKTDYKKALMWFERAAEQGHAEAQYNCGMMYYNGTGTEVNKIKALLWYRKAAEQEDADIQLKINSELMVMQIIEALDHSELRKLKAMEERLK